VSERGFHKWDRERFERSGAVAKMTDAFEFSLQVRLEDVPHVDLLGPAGVKKV